MSEVARDWRSGDESAAAVIGALLRDSARVLVITGAGCSTGSGIPDYRDANGDWKHARPVLYPDFVNNVTVRRRYWARSALGWPRVAAARPNGAHQALAELEARELISEIITQNVDRLHQRAGSRAVLDLHGRLDLVRCIGCEVRLPRVDWQAELALENPGWNPDVTGFTPDGDAEPAAADYDRFQVPACRLCGGILKPDVVFFGETIPAEVSQAARAAVAAADALLVVGSSLMVFSGYRLVRDAAAAGKTVAAINLGRTRADGLLACRWDANCAEALARLLEAHPQARP